MSQHGYLSLSIYIYIYIYTCVHTHLSLYIYIYICVCVCACVCVRVCAHTCMHACMHVPTHLPMAICARSTISACNAPSICNPETSSSLPCTTYFLTSSSNNRTIWPRKNRSSGAENELARLQWNTKSTNEHDHAKCA